MSLVNSLDLTVGKPICLKFNAGLHVGDSWQVGHSCQEKYSKRAFAYIAFVACKALYGSTCVSSIHPYSFHIFSFDTNVQTRTNNRTARWNSIHFSHAEASFNHESRLSIECLFKVLTAAWMIRSIIRSVETCRTKCLGCTIITFGLHQVKANIEWKEFISHGMSKQQMCSVRVFQSDTFFAEFHAGE